MSRPNEAEEIRLEPMSFPKNKNISSDLLYYLIFFMIALSPKSVPVNTILFSDSLGLQHFGLILYTLFQHPGNTLMSYRNNPNFICHLRYILPKNKRSELYKIVQFKSRDTHKRKKARSSRAFRKVRRTGTGRMETYPAQRHGSVNGTRLFRLPHRPLQPQEGCRKIPM